MRMASRLGAAAVLLTLLNAAPAQAAKDEVLLEHIEYCLAAVAAGAPNAVPVPRGIDANAEKALATGGKVVHLTMQRDARGDWVCALGDRSQRQFTALVEDFLHGPTVIDKTRSSYNGNLYMTATLCRGAVPLALILNGPLTLELNMATLVVTGSVAKAACGG